MRERVRVAGPFCYVRDLCIAARGGEENDKTPDRRGERQDAAWISIYPVGAGGPEFCARLRARSNAQGDAGARGVRRQVHDGLPPRISDLLVRESEIVA